MVTMSLQGVQRTLGLDILSDCIATLLPQPDKHITQLKEDILQNKMKNDKGILPAALTIIPDWKMTSMSTKSRFCEAKRTQHQQPAPIHTY